MFLTRVGRIKRLALSRVGNLAIWLALLRRAGFPLSSRCYSLVTPVRIAHVAKRYVCGLANAAILRCRQQVLRAKLDLSSEPSKLRELVWYKCTYGKSKREGVLEPPLHLAARNALSTNPDL